MQRFINSFARNFKKDPIVYLGALILFCGAAVFVLYPVWCALHLSLTKNNQWSLDSYLYIFKKEWLRRSFTNSMLLGVLTATCSVIVGYLYAFLVTRTTSRCKRFLRWMATLPIISPPFMLTLSIVLLFGKNGFVTNGLLGMETSGIYGLFGLVVVQTICMFPIAYLTLVGVLTGIDGSLEDSALNLGASRARTFWDITLKLSIPGIISSWLLVFVTSVADFANPIILAGKFDVLSVQAYLQFTGMGNLELGAALSMLLLVPSIAAHLLHKYYLRRKSFVTVTGKPQRLGRELTSKTVRRSLTAVALGFSFLVLLLYATVLAGCFTKSWGIDYRFSLENFKYVFDIGWSTILSTLLLAIIATPIAGLMGLFSAFLIVRKQFLGRRILDTISMLPFALPGTVVGIGYVLAFNKSPLLLTGTAAIIIISFIYRNMPVGIEAAKASLLQIDKSIEEAATDLGANSMQVFKDITLPLIRPACFAGMAYVFVHCMTAVSAVIFLVSARWNHMTVLILAQSEILRLSAAAVLCLFLIIIVLLVFWLMRVLLKIDLFERGVS